MAARRETSRTSANACLGLRRAGDHARHASVLPHRPERLHASRQRLSLKKHLSPLRRLRLITDWYDHDIDPGDAWAEEISQKLNEADIVLLLISADFVDSNYCYDTELAEAMKKHGAGTAEVIPIIVRPTNAWTNLPFGKLNALPDMGKAIPKWPTQDEGWTNVAAGVERVARQLLARRTGASFH